MKPFYPLFLSFFLLLIASISSYGIVKYEEGNLEIRGVTLLQDHLKSNVYYYVPNSPILSKSNKDNVEFSCIKYITPEGKKTNGGLFHTLFEFSLSEEELEKIQEEFVKLKPKAQIIGPVTLVDNGIHGVASFKLVSSILSNTKQNNPFESKIISSGKVSIDNSKGAIAAQLNSSGTTLLWESLQMNTSDVSIVLEGSYEAYVKAYQAIVKADLNLVYDHFNNPQNERIGYSRNQIQEVIDSFCQNGLIDIEIINKSNTLDFNTQALDQIVNIITEKVSSQLFNMQTSWTKILPMDNRTTNNSKKSRINFSPFLGHRSLPYKSDKKLTLKDKKQIRNFKFYLNLEQSTTIKVPVYTASNLGKFYEEFKNDEQYFSVVTLDDPLYKEREVYFQVDGNFLNSFEDIINHVVVRVQKKDTSNNSIYNNSLEFSRKEVLSGKSIKSINYKRGDNSIPNWQQLEYQIAWDLIGIDTVLQDPSQGWLSSNSASISIAPSFDKVEVEIDADYELFADRGIKSVRIKFGSILLGHPRKGKAMTIRKKDSTQPNMVTLYRDFDQPIVYEVIWYTNNGVKKDNLKILEENHDYLFLVPPTNEK